jgi:6-methylsalicylate decarboxylase
MIIDVHSHVFPPEYTERIAGLGGPLPRLSAAPMSGMSLAQRVEMMDSLGVDMQVLSVGVLQPYYEDARIAIDLARQANESYVDVCRAFPGRFTAFAVLPLPHVDAALAELDRVASDPLVVGVGISTSVLGRPLDDPSWEPLYSELDARAMTVFLHPTMTFPGFGPNNYGMDRSIGAMFEDTMAAARLVLSGVLARHPRASFIAPHLGGTLPFVHGRIARHARRVEDELRAAGVGAGTAPDADGPVEGIRRLYYDTAMRHEPALRCACDTVGADRLVFGTDFPYVKTAEEFAARIEYVNRMPIPERAKAEVLGATAAGLLGLEETS